MSEELIVEASPDHHFAAELNGDGEVADRAWARVYREYGPRLLSFLRARLPRGCDPQDLVQEVIVSAYQARHRFTGRSFAAWIFEIARNRALDKQRQAARRSTQQLGEHNELAAREPEPPSEYAKALAACFEQLTQDHRDVVHARLAGMPFARFSQQFGVPEETAHTRFHRAKQQLRKCLEGKRV